MAEHAASLVLKGSTMSLLRAALLIAVLALAACATVTTDDGTRLSLASAEFRAYVERVFREQNRVADELAFALESGGAGATELEEAEQGLLDACAGLNELATARRDERRLGLAQRAEAARGVPDCERAARAAALAVQRSDSN